MKVKVICTFAGLGKSYLAKKYTYIEDCDIGSFVIPSLDIKQELISRYKSRGNNEIFINRAVKDLEEWHK